MEKLKVLVVDHGVINRKEITEIVNASDFGTVVHSASNGLIAMEWLAQCEIEVILMDIAVIKDMGVSQISTIKRMYPNIEIIVTSENEPELVELTLEAMNRGALDFILRSNKENMDATGLNIRGALEAMFTQIKVKQYLPKTEVNRIFKEVEKPLEKRTEEKPVFHNEIDLVLIASSTGGPVALETVCKSLPANFPKPILIVQHMPPEFTHVLAESIHKKYNTSISEAKAGEVVKPGQMVIAPGGFHMVLEEGFGKTVIIKLLDTPFINGLKPSADLLFSSVAKLYKGMNVLAVVLTGMGNDGTKGIKELKEACNCYCITQSEKTCVVYGMPKCVYEAGLSDEVVDLKDIAFRMSQIAGKKGGSSWKL